MKIRNCAPGFSDHALRTFNEKVGNIIRPNRTGTKGVY
jgi:hypothetical protein